MAFCPVGVDILGPFSQATVQHKFLLVEIDYSTKWVEAESLARITKARVKGFVWKSIIYQYGIPKVIITDNGC